jgi:hypothetical protein
MAFNEKIENRVAPIWMTTKHIIETTYEWKARLTNPQNQARGKLDLVCKHGIKKWNIMFEFLYLQVCGPSLNLMDKWLIWLVLNLICLI